MVIVKEKTNFSVINMTYLGSEQMQIPSTGLIGLYSIYLAP